MTYRLNGALFGAALALTACGGSGDGAVDTSDADAVGGGDRVVDDATVAAPVADGSSPFDPVGAGATGDEPTDPGSDPDLLPEVADNGPIDQAPVGNSLDTATIAGLWDLSGTGEDGDFTRYVQIDETGAVMAYDLQGDGRDCYALSNSRIAARGDDRYDIGNTSGLPGATSPDDVIVLVDGGELVVRYLGEVFDPEFGTAEAGIEERFPASGVTADLLAVCD